MGFSNKAILGQMKTHFGGLEEGIDLMNDGYPNIPDNIDEILKQSDLFPDQNESPTGFKLLNREWDGPYTNEEWQRIILAPHYPLPVEYKKDMRSLEAIKASIEIQSNILNSDSYQKYVSQIDILPKLTKDNASGTSRYEWIRETLPGFGLKDFEGNNNIGFYLHHARKRIKQCVYSVEEQKFKDEITDIIGNPIKAIHDEVKERIAAGETFEN